MMSKCGWLNCQVKKYITWAKGKKSEVIVTVCFCFFLLLLFPRPHELSHGCKFIINVVYRLFGCYNFSSVSCCKTHRLCLHSGLHPSCETLISGTHSSTAGLAEACCLVSSPAGSWLRSWCSPGTTNNCGTLVILEVGLLRCSLGGPHCPVLLSAHFPERGKDLSPGCLGIKALLRFCYIKPWTWNRVVHHFMFCECTLHMFFAEPCVLTAKWFINYGAY